MDLNDDGFQDVLSGSYSRMGQPMAGLFQVLWGQADGGFQRAEPLADAEGRPLEIPPGDDQELNGGVSLDTICTRPTAVDWDGDGDMDLIVGNFGGTFFVFTGEGKGVFLETPEPILVGNAPLKIEGHHSDPFVVDWDGDGDLDLLSGSSQGGVQWAENEAGAGATPRFDSFQQLIPAARKVEFGQLLQAGDLKGPAASTRVYVDDVNSDGKLDLLVGDSVTLTSPAAGMTVEAYEAKLKQWREKLSAASRRMNAAMTAAATPSTEGEDNGADNNDNGGADETAATSLVGGWLESVFGIESSGTREPTLSKQERAQQEISELYEQRSEFMDSETTGHVWLYLQR